jgi:hypothetical protein
VSSPAPTRRGLQSVHIAPYNGFYPGAEPERSGSRAYYYQQSPGHAHRPHCPPTHEGAGRDATCLPTAHVLPTQISGGAHEVDPGQQLFNAIYTDDATTKLNDRIRRRCFNCCTTDTSTWRRSSLNPGKVVSICIECRPSVVRSNVITALQQVWAVRAHTQSRKARAVSPQAWSPRFLISQITHITTPAQRGVSRQCTATAPI